MTPDEAKAAFAAYLKQQAKLKEIKIPEPPKTESTGLERFLSFIIEPLLLIYMLAVGAGIGFVIVACIKGCASLI